MSSSSGEHRPVGRQAPTENGRIRLSNEFATVLVALDETAHGQRLAITDLRTGRTCWFDALELEALAWIHHDEMTQFVDPQRRWHDDPD